MLKQTVRLSINGISWRETVRLSGENDRKLEILVFNVNLLINPCFWKMAYRAYMETVSATR